MIPELVGALGLIAAAVITGMFRRLWREYGDSHGSETEGQWFAHNQSLTLSKRIRLAVPTHPPRWTRTASGGAMGTWSPPETPS